MKKTIQKLSIFLTVFCLLFSAVPARAASPAISKKVVTITVGKSATLKVNNAKGKITWKSSNPKVAAVSKSGKVTGKKAGTAKITANVGKKNYTCKVTVKKAIKISKIQLNKSKLTLNTGTTYKIKVSVSPSKATDKTVVWKSSSQSIASVDSKGLITAKKAGTAIITAKAKDGSEKKATCKVTVKKAKEPKTNRVKKLTLHSKKSVNINGTLQLSVDIQPDGLKKTFTWRSSNPKIATVSSKGLVKGVSSGTVKITATTNDKWKDSISAYITVAKPQETPIPAPAPDPEPSPEPEPVPQKTVSRIEAVCSLKTAGSVKDVNSSNLKVYEIFSDGSKSELKSYSVKGQYDKGTVSYKFTVTTTDGKFQDTFSVKADAVVSEIILVDLDVSCSIKEAEPGYQFKTSDFTVKGIYSNGSRSNIGFKVDISYTDVFYQITITAGNITKTLSIPVKKVSQPTVTSLSYSLNPSYVYVGANLSAGQLKVTANYSDGSQKEVSDYTTTFTPQPSAGIYSFDVIWKDIRKTLSITVKEKELPKPTLTGLDAKFNRSYIYSDETPSASDIVLTGTYSDGSSRPITDYTYDFSPAAGHLQKATLTIHYAGKDMPIRITSIVKTEPKSVEFKFINSPIGTGENIDKNNITLTVTDYAGNVTTPTDFNIDYSPKSEPGTYPFSVSYKGFSESFKVTVIQKN